MADPTQDDLVKALLARHGTTFAEELKLDVAKNTPSALFGLLCASVLMSARIGHGIATEAARNVIRRWKTAQRLAESSWDERVDVLHDAGYTRYQERTATMLCDVADHALERYRGDLRRLRDEAEREPKWERRLLREFKGLGDVGIDIFFREAQVGWTELEPFADRRALEAAGRLRLPRDPEKLRRLAGPKRYPNLVAALVRTELEGAYRDVRAAARGR